MCKAPARDGIPLSVYLVSSGQAVEASWYYRQQRGLPQLNLSSERIAYEKRINIACVARYVAWFLYLLVPGFCKEVKICKSILD